MKLRFVLIGVALVVALAAGAVAVASSGDGAVEEPGDRPFVGLTVDAAVAQAEEEGRPWRIARQDGTSFALTDDLLPGRVTFEVDGGVVTSAVVEQPSLPGDDEPAPVPERADLVAAAVRQLVTVDNSFGVPAPFDQIRVAGTEGDEIERIAAALPGVAVRHVADADAEIAALFDESPAGVAVVAVERVDVLGEQAEVGLRLWCGSLCGVFLTYEAGRDAGAWTITGTTGPVAVS